MIDTEHKCSMYDNYILYFCWSLKNIFCNCAIHVQMIYQWYFIDISMICYFSLRLHVVMYMFELKRQFQWPYVIQFYYLCNRITELRLWFQEFVLLETIEFCNLFIWSTSFQKGMKLVVNPNNYSFSVFQFPIGTFRFRMTS